MDDLNVFVIYLTLFRLAIIAAVIISIVLGYRLFVRGVFPRGDIPQSAGGHSVDAEVAGAKFRLLNAAPGTCFALFGAIILVAMFLTGGPKGTFESAAKGDQKVTLRGDDFEETLSQSKRALDYLEQGDRDKAREAVVDALEKLAPLLNDFAWVLFKTSAESTQALWLAEIAVDTAPRNPNFLHTLAEIQYHTGNKAAALQTLEKAQAIAPSYSEQLEKWRKAITDAN
jgi:tetratricopeptide (TPR) repeat protein